MPKYVYRCSACDFVFEVFHSMSVEFEKYHCEQCEGEQEVDKLPSAFYSFNRDGNKGTLVKSFISDAKRELKQQRKEAQEAKHVGTNNISND